MPDSAPIVKMKELPCGMYNARLDDKGRIKLPTEFQRYFGALDDPRLFVTSVDRRIARIFPLALWRAHEHFIETYAADPKLPQRMLFNAADLGGEAEMDGQGRVLFPPELRRELGIENQSVRIRNSKGWVEVLSEKIYEEMRRDAAGLTADDVTKVEAPRPN
jgi:MraZ protein